MEITRININDTKLNRLQKIGDKQKKGNLFKDGGNKRQTRIVRYNNNLAAKETEQAPLTFKGAMENQAKAKNLKDSFKAGGAVLFGSGRDKKIDIPNIGDNLVEMQTFLEHGIRLKGKDIIAGLLDDMHLLRA